MMMTFEEIDVGQISTVFHAVRQDSLITKIPHCMCMRWLEVEDWFYVNTSRICPRCSLCIHFYISYVLYFCFSQTTSRVWYDMHREHVHTQCCWMCRLVSSTSDSEIQLFPCPPRSERNNMMIIFQMRCTFHSWNSVETDVFSHKVNYKMFGEIWWMHSHKSREFIMERDVVGRQCMQWDWNFNGLGRSINLKVKRQQIQRCDLIRS